MGRVGFADVNNYGNGGGGGFFSLKNDKDVAKVRFMLDNEEDLNNIAYAVHRVKLGDKERNVSCLRSYNEPVSKCPFCADLGPAQIKFYVPLYNLDDEEVQMWERGKTFASKLSSLMSRYGAKTPLVNHVFEVERNGEKGNMKTTYETYEIDCDDTMLEDLPEIPEVIGNVYILDKSEDDMNYYLDEGEFPPDDDYEPVQRRRQSEEVEDDEPPFEEAEDNAPRRGNSDRSARRDSGDRNSRRTPSSSNKSAGTSRRRSF